MKYIGLLISFIFIVALSNGQSYHEEEIKVKKFDEAKWKEIVGSTNYEEDPDKADDKGPTKPGKPWFSLPAIDPQLLRTISFAIVFGLFAFILYYVSRNTSISKKKKKKIKPGDAAAPVENIDELDIESLLRDALAGGDLRLAIRVHYLLLLKKLNDAELIKWKKNKTNRDYLSELYGRHASYDDVRMLTLAYELVWYGERSVSPDSFQKLSGDFESVSRRITEVQQPA